MRGPLEVSWYRDGVLEIPDRHAQGPAPLFHRGVLVVEGVHGVCALDAYNGRTLWVYPIPEILADWTECITMWAWGTRAAISALATTRSSCVRATVA